MAFALPEERLALMKRDFPLELVVQIETRTGAEVELAADDVEHALCIAADWNSRGARWTEIFRVSHDGSLKPTIGRVEHYKVVP